MRYCLFTLFVLCCLGSGHAQEGPVRLLVERGGRYGYIDGNGDMVIEARFAAGSDFSEGVAAVRRGGYYGYIDANGTVVIDFQYDYAEDFVEGLAKVYVAGVPALIDHYNQVQYQSSGDDFTRIAGLPIVVHRNEDNYREYLTDYASGDTVLDSTYQHIYVDAEEGMARISYPAPGSDPDDYNPTVFARAFDLRTCEWVTPAEKYWTISPFRNNLATARRSDEGGVDIIDRTGRVVHTFADVKLQPAYFDDINFAEGLIPVDVYRFDPCEEPPKLPYAQNHRIGFVDTTGRVVFTTSDYEVNNFLPGGTAIAEPTTDHWQSQRYLIDTSGLPLPGLRAFDQVYVSFYDGQQLGYAADRMVARRNDTLLLIDGRGNSSGQEVVLPADFGNVQEDLSLKWDGRIATFSFEYYQEEEDDYQMGGGWWDPTSGFIQLVSGRIERYSSKYISYYVPDGTRRYYQTNGTLIAEFPFIKHQRERQVDIDFMLLGYGYIDVPDPRYGHGYGMQDSNRTPQPNDQLLPSVPKGQSRLVLHIDTTQVETFRNSRSGHPVYIINETKDTLHLHSQDNRLDLRAEARSDGEPWRPIESLTRSWCGNSYFDLALPNSHHWQITMPRYTGSIPVEVRLRLNGVEGYVQKDIVSNSVRMSVNPAQFWRKRAYQSQGLMDPYGSY